MTKPSTGRLERLVESPPGGLTGSTAQTEPRSACSPRFLVRARGARRHQVAAEVGDSRAGCGYGDDADRQRDRAYAGITPLGVLTLEFRWLTAAGDGDGIRR